MSVVFEITLRCDFCDSDHDDAQFSVQRARMSARKDGWRKRKIDGKWLDICDSCQDEQNNAECEQALEETVQR